MIDWTRRGPAGALAAGILAVIAAVVITYFATKRATASTPRPQPERTTPAETVTPVQHSFFSDRPNQPSAPVLPAASAVPVTERKQPTSAEVRRSIDEGREKLMNRYRAEVPDPSWSATEQTRISGRLADMKKDMRLEVSVDDIACRSTICLVSLRWPSWETGQRERKMFVSKLSGDEGCGHFVHMPPKDNEPGEYSTQVILDCESQRTGDTPALPLEKELSDGTQRRK